jgi:dihydroflavonol-4-reductase
VNVLGARMLDRFHAWRGSDPPLDVPSTEMGERFWYCDSRKAEAELDFTARDPQETLYDTVRWLDEHVRRKARPVRVEDLGAAAGPPRPAR